MKKTLQQHLCLTRPNFQINPKQSFEDASLYFGEDRNEKMILEIETGYMAGFMPRIYVMGQYGTGKTHLLYHLKHHFSKSALVMPFVVQVEAESKTRYQSLHKKLLDAMGLTLVEKTYRDFAHEAGAGRDVAFAEIFPDPNLQKVMQILPSGPALQSLAWRWLIGDKLTSGEQQNLGVTTSASETGELVQILVSIGELFRRCKKNLLFLIDEGEALHNVTNHDAQRSWHDGFKRLAESNDNQSVGWILSFYTALQDEPPTFMFEGDITTRLGRKGVVRLEPLLPVQVEDFLRDLLKAFVDKECAKKRIESLKLDTKPEIYPFTDEGLVAFVNHAKVAADQAIPRNILKAMTACALETLRGDKALIDGALVDKVAPQEFTEAEVL